MSFRKWLEQQVERDDPIGDLARDARDDWMWPPKGRLTRRRLTSYLQTRGACREAIDALREAWAEYGRGRATPNLRR